MKTRRPQAPLALLLAMGLGLGLVLVACSEPDQNSVPGSAAGETPIGPIGVFGDYTAPQTRPLDSVEELAAWQPGSDPWNVAALPLRERAPIDEISSPWFMEAQPAAIKLLHCHDMMGGYVASIDLNPQGVDNDAIYNFSYFQYVDTFVYFSHHRVTVPPPGWTNAAHRSGVRVLGTFITGGSDASEVTSLVDEPEAGVFPMADQLVEMAAYYGFDGWFLNIETPLPDGSPVCETCDRLARFLDNLRTKLHERSPSSQVIWYDSVTASGTVAYQNSLTLENKLYFDESDGLFTNYWWDPDPAYPNPQKSASVAGERRYDVYTGTDVFGRGTYAGGGYSTYVALAEIAAAGTSAALFAPGWTYEKASEAKPYSAREDRVWTGTGARDCAPEAGVAEFIRARPVPPSIPFVTSFNQGQGPSFFLGGEKVYDKPRANIADIDVLPTWRRCPVAGAGAEFITSPATNAAYDGPSSRWIGAPGAAAGDYSVQALYKTRFAIDRELTFSYTVLPSGLDLAALLLLDDQTAVVLGGPGSEDFLGEVDLGASFQRVLRAPDSTDSTGASAGWETRDYKLDSGLKGRTVEAIGLVAFAPVGSAPPPTPVALLGEISLFDPASGALDTAAKDLEMTDVVWSDASGSLTVGLTLTWSGDVTAARHFDVLQVAPEQPPRWLGRAFTNRFSVAPGTVTPFNGENLVRFEVFPGYPRRAKTEPAKTALLWAPP